MRYDENGKKEAAGVERKLRTEIVIKHGDDLGIIAHLTAQMGFDVDTEHVQTGQWDGETRIKVFEIIKHKSAAEIALNTPTSRY